MGDLANYPLKYLKQSFGVIGEELHLHSNGIDFSRISEKYVPVTTSIEKPILMRDYTMKNFRLSYWNIPKKFAID